MIKCDSDTNKHSVPFLKMNAMACQSLQRKTLNSEHAKNAMLKLTARLKKLLEPDVQLELGKIAKDHRDICYAMFIDYPVGPMTRRMIEYNAQNEDSVYILKFIASFDAMVKKYIAALDTFLEAENDSGSEYLFIDVDEELEEGDDKYELQKKVKQFLEFKGLNMEEFKKRVSISSVLIESGFSSMKYRVSR